MAEGITTLTLAQLNAIGKYANVQFIWDDAQSGNLLFSVPFTDVDGTAGVHPVTYINLATLFEVAQGAAVDSGPGTLERVAQESHDATFSTIGALTAAQAKALKVPNVIFVDGDPTGGSDLIWTLADEPKTWVIDFTALFDVAIGEFAGHQSLGEVGNGGEITRAELASVNRLTINFVNSGPDTSLLYTVEGSGHMYIVNLSQFIHDGVASNEIAAASHTH